MSSEELDQKVVVGVDTGTEKDTSELLLTRTLSLPNDAIDATICAVTSGHLHSIGTSSGRWSANTNWNTLSNSKENFFFQTEKDYLHFLKSIGCDRKLFFGDIYSVLPLTSKHNKVIIELIKNDTYTWDKDTSGWEDLNIYHGYSVENSKTAILQYNLQRECDRAILLNDLGCKNSKYGVYSICNRSFNSIVTSINKFKLAKKLSS